MIWVKRRDFEDHEKVDNINSGYLDQVLAMDLLSERIYQV